MKYVAMIISVFAVVATGCSSTIDAADYDQSCETADQCIAVLVGDICTCGCEYQAIASSAMSKYQTDRSDAYGTCIGLYQCDACQLPGPVACTAGKCTVGSN